MRESSQLTRVRESRAGLLTTHPFFGVLSLNLELIENAAVKNIRVNSKTLTVAPDYVDSLSNAQLKGTVAQQCLHLGMCHHARQGARDAAMWNDACDYAVNPLLIADGFTLPPGALIDSRFDGKSAEQIYSILRDEKQDSQPQQPPQPQGGNKPQPGGSNAPGQAQGTNGQPDPNGTPAPSQAGKGDESTGSFESAGPEGSAAANDAGREWEENANQALRAASSAGKLPGHVKKAVTEALQAKADYYSLLREFMNDANKTRRDWNKRNKRFRHIYIPGKVRDGMGEIVLAVDSSQSIFSSPAAVNRFSAHLNQLIADVDPACVHVVYCDTQVAHVESFEQGDPIKLDMQGGGGTKFSPVFDYVDAQGWQPAALIYLTDLECSDYPAAVPEYPVLWAAYDAKGRVAPFGETVAID